MDRASPPGAEVASRLLSISALQSPGYAKSAFHDSFFPLPIGMAVG